VEETLNHAIFAQTTLLLLCLAAPPRPTMGQDHGATTPQNAKPSAVNATSAAPVEEPASVSKAMHLYRDGKYEEARTEYNRVIQNGFNAPTAYAGLARLELKQNRLAEAANAANKGMELGPKLAATHIALGEVYFRQGKIEEAGEEFRRLVQANTSDARAYYGMSRVMHVSSYHGKEKLLLDRAHELNGKDPDIRRAWIGSLNLTDRIKEMRGALGEDTTNEAERASTEKQLVKLEEVAKQPPRLCRMAAGVKSTQTDLQPMMYDAKRAKGYGLPVKLNGTSSRLLLDTGAGGITITKRIAEKAGIQKMFDTSISGIGDLGNQAGYVGYADSVKIGDLEFHNCYVEVMEKNFLEGEDGLLGADIFSDFLVDLDFPNQKLRLSELPDDPQQAGKPAGLDSPVSATRQHHDRYVAPEMKGFTPVYRQGHELLLPTKVNDKAKVFFLIDTGSVENMISLDAARQNVKVGETDAFRVKGLNGEVKKVFRAQDVILQFAGFRQRMNTMLCLDMTKISNDTGTEVSGVYGFAVLHMLEMKIDYRDGLVDLKFDPKRFY
jgi:predicted aspartyl protease